MDKLAVELVEVFKLFKGPGGTDATAVNGIHLQIQDGEFFSLLGPSGCGKTTTLRMIAGFEQPSRGEIFIHGQPMAGRPPFHRSVNTVFQNYALFPHLTVAQNIAFGLEMDNLPKAQVRRRVGDMLALVRLEGKENAYPRQLSGGQQQRVALARALVKQPEVLLLDEPLGALDLKLRKEMQIELKHMQQQVGITFVFVTHDQEEALTMSDRIAVMHQGNVLQVGSPVDIYERPADAFVAGFIGESNFLAGQVAERNHQEAVVLVDNHLPIRVSLEDALVNIGHAVTLVLRPEKATLHSPGSCTEHCWAGTVEETLYLGTDTRYVVRLTDKSRIVVRNQNLHASDAQNFPPGSPVHVGVHPSALRILAAS
ncbi:MAG: ABC transporter ATP-binding protein [Gloeomargaritaceae cyanobacterium C42_A2020_066]|nr:ABC transporter ATP-binding protein [Gloeomargaritaceae cyanobacterium C42_A2020_066]